MEVKNIAVIGGGISGTTMACEIAETGHHVTLIEEKPYLGGRVLQFSSYFPKLCPPQCGLEINFGRIKRSPLIEILPHASVVRIEGTASYFQVLIRKKAALINSNCTSCGKCAEVCPETRVNDFDMGLSTTKVAWLPHELAFPYKYHIDETLCKKEACGKCLEVCAYDAIDLTAKEEIIVRSFHSVVYATGWEPYDLKKVEMLQYGKHPDIISNLEVERYLAPNGPTKGVLLKPSDQSVPESISFIQCAGSRDQNHLPYCSAVCCSATLKQALIISEQIKNIRIRIYYIDLRVSGRNEDMLEKVKNIPNIELIKGKAGSVLIENNALFVEAEDIHNLRKLKDPCDMVVLAGGIQANDVMDTQQQDIFGFADEDKLPVGVFATACCKKPSDVATSLKDATGIALKAIQNHSE